MHTIDTHSHLNLPPFASDWEVAIARMREAGVGTIVVGIDYETSARAVALAEQESDIWACVGQHPTHHAVLWRDGHMRALAESPRVVAIGECGLDYFREPDRLQKDAQLSLFQAQVALAIEMDLPLMLHIRPESGTMTAYEDALLELIRAKEFWPTMRGTAHFFAGTKEIADQFIALGFYISFSGVVTFASEYEALVAHVPLDRILSETDAPYATPAPYRGTRNEPAYATEVVKKIAQIKGGERSEIQQQLFKNARHLFGLDR